MSAGTPSKLSVKPPKPPQNSALERLEALNDWTEEPARDAASCLVEKPSAKPTESLQVERKVTKAGKGSANPWEAVEGAKQTATKSVNYKIPIEIYQKLKWLGGTTFGMDMTGIVVEALQEKIDKMIKAREKAGQ